MLLLVLLAGASGLAPPERIGLVPMTERPTAELWALLDAPHEAARVASARVEAARVASTRAEEAYLASARAEESTSRLGARRGKHESPRRARRQREGSSRGGRLTIARVRLSGTQRVIHGNLA